MSLSTSVIIKTFLKENNFKKFSYYQLMSKTLLKLLYDKKNHSKSHSTHFNQCLGYLCRG
jgi:hypothetical protein